jgi:hypothetical protein
MLPEAVRRAARRGARSVRRWRGPQRPGIAAPAVPPGWRTGPPDFVGLGAQKAGTSWWFSLLSAHPAIHTVDGVPKELHYFDRYFAAPFGPAEVQAYHRLFPRPPGTITGEWTPGYLSDFWAPAQIRLAAPDARLLVLLRDPVERYRSGLTHTAGQSRSPLRRADAIGAYVRGLYAQQLERLYAYFPREQVLVLQYERCRAAPVTELARTFAFLGVDPALAPPARFERRVNETMGGKVPMPDDIRRALVSAYRPEIERLPSLAPGLDLTLWPDFS